MKTSLISSVSYFNLGVKAFFGRLSGNGTEFRAPCDSVGPQSGGMEGGWYGYEDDSMKYAVNSSEVSAVNSRYTW